MKNKLFSVRYLTLKNTHQNTLELIRLSFFFFFNLKKLKTLRLPKTALVLCSTGQEQS